MSIKPISKTEDYWEPIMQIMPGFPDKYTGEVINRYTGERIFMPGLGEAHLLCKVLNERDTLRTQLAAVEAERDTAQTKADIIEEAWRDIQEFVSAAYRMAGRGHLDEPEDGAIVDLLRMALKEQRELREHGRMTDLEHRISDLELAIENVAAGLETLVPGQDTNAGLAKTLRAALEPDGQS